MKLFFDSHRIPFILNLHRCISCMEDPLLQLGVSAAHVRQAWCKPRGDKQALTPHRVWRGKHLLNRCISGHRGTFLQIPWNKNQEKEPEIRTRHGHWHLLHFSFLHTLGADSPQRKQKNEGKKKLITRMFCLSGYVSFVAELINAQI